MYNIVNLMVWQNFTTYVKGTDNAVKHRKIFVITKILAIFICSNMANLLLIKWKTFMEKLSQKQWYIWKKCIWWITLLIKIISCSLQLNPFKVLNIYFCWKSLMFFKQFFFWIAGNEVYVSHVSKLLPGYGKKFVCCESSSDF